MGRCFWEVERFTLSSSPSSWQARLPQVSQAYVKGIKKTSGTFIALEIFEALSFYRDSLNIKWQKLLFDKLKDWVLLKSSRNEFPVKHTIQASKIRFSFICLILVLLEKSADDLKEVPQLFMNANFSLENSETFHSVFPDSYIDAKSSDKRNVKQSLKLLQEKVTT